MRTFRDAPPLIEDSNRDENDVVKEQTHANKDASGLQKKPKSNFKKGNPSKPKGFQSKGVPAAKNISSTYSSFNNEAGNFLFSRSMQKSTTLKFEILSV